MFNGQVFSHGESCKLPHRPATQRLFADVLLVFVPEIFSTSSAPGSARSGRGRRGWRADDGAKILEFVEVGPARLRHG